MTASIAQRVRARLVAEVDPSAVVHRDLIETLVRNEAPLLDDAGTAAAVSEVLADVVGLGPLEPYLDDPQVTEIMVNGPGRVWLERAGTLVQSDTSLRAAEIDHLIEKVVGPLGLRVDRSSPAVDARLPDGSRVHAIVPPLAVDGPYLTIRRFRRQSIPLRQFCTEAVAALLERAVAERRNIIVSGGTGSGKTTLLNALAAAIPGTCRIVTVEDAAELRLAQAHVVRLEARPANAEGVGQVTIRELVRNALRMRPDRVIVGECRGPEALDMLTAMNTGHEGSMSTCHANSPADALRRLDTMVLIAGEGLPLDAVRDQLHAAVDLVVEVGRGANGLRHIAAVDEVTEPGTDGARTRPVVRDGQIVGEWVRPAR